MTTPANEKIPCSCPKGGMYEMENGNTRICERCDGTEWVDTQNTPANEWREEELGIEDSLFELKCLFADINGYEFDGEVGTLSLYGMKRVERLINLITAHSAHLVERISDIAIVDDYGEERKIGFQIAKDQAIDIVKKEV